MSLKYIDSILCKLNNKISCIWISGFIFIDKIPNHSLAKKAFIDLIHEYALLRTKKWDGIPSKIIDNSSLSLHDWIAKTITMKINLGQELPLRLGFREFKSGEKVFFSNFITQWVTEEHLHF